MTVPVRSFGMDYGMTRKEREVLSMLASRRGVGLLTWIALIVAVLSLAGNVYLAARVRTLERRIEKWIESQQRDDPTYTAHADWQAEHVGNVATHSHADDVSTLCSVPGCGIRHFSSCPFGDRHLARESGARSVPGQPLSTSDFLRTLMSVASPGGHSLAVRHSTVGMIGTPMGVA